MFFLSVLFIGLLIGFISCLLSVLIIGGIFDVFKARFHRAGLIRCLFITTHIYIFIIRSIIRLIIKVFLMGGHIRRETPLRHRRCRMAFKARFHLAGLLIGLCLSSTSTYFNIKVIRCIY